jgi:putative nucleotidyltransferase with HDIG domain
MLKMAIVAEIRSPGTVSTPWALKDLPPYRPVARKLMMLTAKAEVPLEEVQRVLRTDAAFTADVLRLANSPLIGMRSEIKSVLQAIMMLGIERIKALSTTLALRTFLMNAVPDDPLHACWRHNLATAILCDRLARILHEDSDTCYTAGLLHDIGRLALLSVHPDKYLQILDMDSPDDNALLLREKAAFEVDHCVAGEWIITQWDFPVELREVVSTHHRRPRAGASILLPIVYAGWRMADLLGFSIWRHPVAGEIEDILSVLPGKAPQQVLAEYDGLAEEVAFKINAIECSLL